MRTRRTPASGGATADRLRRHWPEYLIEAWGLGTFMVSAVLFTALLEYPGWGLPQWLPEPDRRRLLIALAMGLTALCIIYSPWGKRSGAHINPAVTFTFWRLGKIRTADALFYAAAQFAGGTAGVLLSALLLGPVIAAPSVNYAVTVPGPAGVGVAFACEFVIAFLMMTTVLHTSNRPRFAPFTGLFAGGLIVLYVGFESPFSGFGMNPARTFASALPAGVWTAAWIYFVVPVAAMLSAAEIYVRTHGISRVRCAKLQHGDAEQCIFRCGYRQPPTQNLP
nr:aquaporin [Gloeobacter violaceus]